MISSTALEGGQEVGVAGGAGSVEVQAVGAGLDHALGDEHHVVHGVLHGLFLGRAGFVDAAQRQQLGPVGHRPVGLRVAAQVGHGAVLQRHRRQQLCLAHQHGLRRGQIVLIALYE